MLNCAVVGCGVVVLFKAASVSNLNRKTTMVENTSAQEVVLVTHPETNGIKIDHKSDQSGPGGGARGTRQLSTSLKIKK